MVAVEIAVLPLAFGLARYVLLFSILTMAILTIRIRVENAALRGRSGSAAV
jgi:methyltransferase